MRSVSYRLADLIKARIPLGFVGENEHTVVQFDAKQAFDQYPTATPSLTVKNPSGEKYPAVVVRDGDMVIWTISDSDLIVPGHGEFQLQFKEGDTVMRSYVGETRIERSIMPTGDVPTPVQNWIDQAIDVLEEVEDAIPAGGTTGQVLAKKSDADRDTEWVNQSGGGGGAEIDDTAGEGDTDVVWSADKTWTETEALKEAISDKQDAPSVAGSSGQAMMLDNSGNPVWQTPPGGMVTDTVTGTTVSITGQANHRYLCGTVTEITITPPQTGMVDVMFTAGSSCVLSLPNTVKLPDWFDATSLEQGTVYEINIMDGVYGVVGSWT